MENILEVKESEDSSVINSSLRKKIMNGSESEIKDLNKFNKG